MVFFQHTYTHLYFLHREKTRSTAYIERNSHSNRHEYALKRVHNNRKITFDCDHKHFPNHKKKIEFKLISTKNVENNKHRTCANRNELKIGANSTILWKWIASIGRMQNDCDRTMCECVCFSATFYSHMANDEIRRRETYVSQYT